MIVENKQCKKGHKKGHIDDHFCDLFSHNPPPSLLIPTIMQDAGRAAVEKKGFFEIDMDGDMVTPLVPGSEECVYTLFDEEGNFSHKIAHSQLYFHPFYILVNIQRHVYHCFLQLVCEDALVHLLNNL